MAEYERTTVVCTHCGRPMGGCACGAERYAKAREVIEMSDLEALLRTTADRFRKLDTEASKALRGKRDPDKYADIMVERAKLIAQLPEKIEELDKDVLDENTSLLVSSFAGEAKERIESYEETGNTFGLRILLVPLGSKIGDPNELESLINKLFPDSFDNAASK